jgi:hypothetical protein
MTGQNIKIYVYKDYNIEIRNSLLTQYLFLHVRLFVHSKTIAYHSRRNFGKNHKEKRIWKKVTVYYCYKCEACHQCCETALF